MPSLQCPGNEGLTIHTVFAAEVQVKLQGLQKVTMLAQPTSKPAECSNSDV